MASFVRAVGRCQANPISTTFRNTAIQRHAFRPAIQRNTYSSARQGSTFRPRVVAQSSTRMYASLAVLGIGGAAGAYYYLSQSEDISGAGVKKASDGKAKGIFSPQKADYQKVYNMIAKLLEEKDQYDDGSYGPVIVRLAWHCSGTYDAMTGTGGSNGATMRFAPEGDHGANAGLKAARDFLEPVKNAFPWITYSDLWTLAGVCAFQQMQGPSIPWRPGRTDRDVSACTPDGRLPDGSKEQTHLRAIFGRMGFDDRETVALSGAHALGRCHTDRSGFEGPWSFSPTVMSNDYYRLLLDEKWNFRKWNGPKQYEDQSSKSLMMLPTDMALVKDKEFRKHVERYAKDDQVFFQEFRDVIVKLFELGVPFKSSPDERFTFAVFE